MGYAGCIGRVGALAVALGVGVAVVTTPGPANAEPSDSGSSASDSSSTGHASSTSTGTASASTSSAADSEGSPADPPSASGESGGVSGAGSNGPPTSTAGTADTSANDRTAADSAAKTPNHPPADKISLRKNRSTLPAARPRKPRDSRPTVDSAPQTRDNPASNSPPAASAAPTSRTIDIDVFRPQAAMQQRTSLAPDNPALPTTSAVRQAVSSPAITAATPLRAVATLVSNVLGLVRLDLLAENRPGGPTESPALWAVLAWARGRFPHSLVERAPNVGVDTVQSGQTLAAAATTTNSAPTAAPTVTAADPVSGIVTGSVNALDYEGSSLTYSVTGSPADGTVVVTSAGNYTYTPTLSARLAAGQTAEAYVDSFVVTVSDSQAGTPVTVTVPVAPLQLQLDQTITVGISPNGVAVGGTTAYVANQGSNTVSVINTGNPGASAANPIVVGLAPTAITLSPDGTRAYLANSGSGTVSVIDTATNTVVDTITVGLLPQGVAVKPGGATLYVANSGSGTVSVIDTATNTVTNTITVGLLPHGIAVKPGGATLYVANSGSNTISAINTANNTVFATVSVGSMPRALAVSPDGSRLYVANSGGNTVSVLNTTTGATVATISVGTGPSGLVLSRDGGLAYVANSDGTVSVIDTKKNTVVSTASIGLTAATGAQIALSPDGNRIYLTDQLGGSVSVLSTRVNTAPQASGAPTAATPNAGTGTVRGSLNVTDTDGDMISYTVTGAPAAGTVTVDAAGTYTYTPTQAARLSAGLTAGVHSDTFTVTASDGRATTSVTVTVPVVPTTMAANGAAVSLGNAAAGVALSGGRAYVANYGENTVSVVDTASQRVLATIAVGRAPTFVAVSSDGARVYVANQKGNTVSVIDTAGNQVVATVETGAQPFGVAVSPNGSRVYVANMQSHTVSVIDTATNQVVATVTGVAFPSGVGVSADGNRVYVAGLGGTVSVIDTATYQVVDSPIRVGNQPVAVTVAPNGARVYVANTDGTVSVIDTATNATVGEPIAVGSSPYGLAVSPDGSLVYVSNSDDTVSVIDAMTNTVIETVTVDTTPENGLHFIAVSPDGSRVFITDASDRTLRTLTMASPLNLSHNFVDDDEGSPTAADTGQPVVLSYYPDAAALPVLGSDGYVIEDTASHATAGYWTAPLSDGGRVVYVEAQFEMTDGMTAGQAAVIALWQNPLPSGSLMGVPVQSSPCHVVFVENGYMVQFYDSVTGAKNIGMHAYSRPIGTGVQSVTLALDVAAQTLTVVGPDGQQVTFGPDLRFVSVPGYYATAEIYYTNASTDGRVKFLSFGADSAIPGSTQTSVL